jgi:hypothetical protein
LILVTAWTVWRRLPARPVAAAWLLFGTLHLTYHARHVEGYDTVDKIGLIGSLVAVPVLALVTLWAGWSSSATSSRDATTPSH